MKKGIECVYDESGKREVLISPAAASTVRAGPCSRLSVSIAKGPSHADDEILSNGKFDFGPRDDAAVDDAPNQFISGNDCAPVDQSTQTFPLNEAPTFDELLLFEDDTCLADISLALYDKIDQQSRSWCAWMGRDISLSVVTENPIVEPDSDLLTLLQMERPHAKHNAILVIQSLR
jgi:hypothetical protein